MYTVLKEDEMSDAPKSPPAAVASEAATAYRTHAPALVDHVNSALEARVDLDDLIGANPLAVMRDNHANHARFMSNVFALSSFELIESTVPWVYRAYGQHGFSNDYFPAVVRAFRAAVCELLASAVHADLCAVYDWMLESHERFLAAASTARPPDLGEQAEAERGRVVEMMLAGERRALLAHAKKRVTTPEELKRFYLQVLMPAMYEIGRRWERGEISVAHEHLASALAGQVMATLYPVAAGSERSKGVAVVTAAPNEHHEMGARMVSDLLECDGWDVRYLGANTPPEELVEILREAQPHLLCVSVAMPFNLTGAGEMIAAVRNAEGLDSIRIMVGGKTLNEVGSAVEMLGADGFARDASEAVELAAGWWSDEVA